MTVEAGARKPLAALFDEFRQDLAARDLAPLYRVERVELANAEHLIHRVTDDHEKMLVQLQTDLRMSQAWQTLRQSVSDENVVHILHTITDIRWRADCNAELARIKSEHKKKFEWLISQNKKLIIATGELSKYLQSEGPHLARYPKLQGVNVKDRIDTASEALLSLGQLLTEVGEIEQGAIEDKMPTSQKRDQATAFAILLCREVQDLVGDPHYAFAATAADVVFGGKESMSVEKVRKAFKYDERNRPS